MNLGLMIDVLQNAATHAMIDAQPALVGADRRRSRADLKNLPGLFGSDQEVVLLPKGKLVATLASACKWAIRNPDAGSSLGDANGLNIVAAICPPGDGIGWAVQ